MLCEQIVGDGTDEYIGRCGPCSRYTENDKFMQALVATISDAITPTTTITATITTNTKIVLVNHASINANSKRMVDITNAFHDESTLMMMLDCHDIVTHLHALYLCLRKEKKNVNLEFWKHTMHQIRNAPPCLAELSFVSRFPIAFTISRFDSDIYRKHALSSSQLLLWLPYCPEPIIQPHHLSQPSSSVSDVAVCILGPNPYGLHGLEHWRKCVTPLLKSANSNFRLLVYGSCCRVISDVKKEELKRAGIDIMGEIDSLQDVLFSTPPSKDNTISENNESNKSKNKNENKNIWAVHPAIAGTGVKTQIADVMKHGVPILAFDTGPWSRDHSTPIPDEWLMSSAEQMASTLLTLSPPSRQNVYDIYMMYRREYALPALETCRQVVAQKLQQETSSTRVP